MIKIKLNKILLYSPIMAVIFVFFAFSPSAWAEEINMRNVVELTNREREKQGMGELLINPTLNQVAANKAQHMVRNHYFSHTSPEGLSPWHWFEEEGYQYKYAGENLAINYKTAEEQQSAWMKSPTHKKNILNPNYTEIGIATASGYINGKPASITVQVFGTPQNYIGRTSSPASSNKTKTAQISMTIPYVLGKQANYPAKTQYLVKSDPSFKYESSISSIKNSLFESVKRQSENIIWAVMIILGIIITRDLVLKSIAAPTVHRHSMTNLVLLLMLWTVFIGL